MDFKVTRYYTNYICLQLSNKTTFQKTAMFIFFTTAVCVSILRAKSIFAIEVNVQQSIEIIGKEDTPYHFTAEDFIKGYQPKSNEVKIQSILITDLPNASATLRKSGAGVLAGDVIQIRETSQLVLTPNIPNLTGRVIFNFTYILDNGTFSRPVIATVIFSPVNDRPSLVAHPRKQLVRPDTVFSYKIAESLFEDPDAGQDREHYLTSQVTNRVISWT